MERGCRCQISKPVVLVNKMRLSLLILVLVVGAILTAANPSQLRTPHEDNGRSRRGVDFDLSEEIEKILKNLKEKVSDSDALKQIVDALAVAKSKITASVQQMTAKAEIWETLNKALKELKDAKAKLVESIEKMQGMDSADVLKKLEWAKERVTKNMERIQKKMNSIVYQSVEDGLKDAKKFLSAAIGQVKNDEVADNVKAAMEGVTKSIDQGLKKMIEMEKLSALEKLEKAKGKIDDVITSLKDKEAYAKSVKNLNNAKAKIDEYIDRIKTKVTEAKAF